MIVDKIDCHTVGKNTAHFHDEICVIRTASRLLVGGCICDRQGRAQIICECKGFQSNWVCLCSGTLLISWMTAVGQCVQCMKGYTRSVCIWSYPRYNCASCAREREAVSYRWPEQLHQMMLSNDAIKCEHLHPCQRFWSSGLNFTLYYHQRWRLCKLTASACHDEWFKPCSHTRTGHYALA